MAEMSKYAKSRLHMIICEEAFKLYSNPKRFATFRSWCEYMRTFIVSEFADSTTYNVNKVRVELIKTVGDIFGYDYKEADAYIREFFETRQYIEFEEVAQLSVTYLEKPISKVFDRLELLKRGR